MTVEALLSRLAQTSLRGTLLILAVLLLRLLLQKTPRRVICLLWGLVGLRLLLPIRLESRFGLVTLPPQASDVFSGGTALAEKTGTTNTAVLCWLWGIGLACLRLYTAVHWLRVFHSVRSAVRAEDGAWACDRVSTPFVFGLIQTRIYLPNNLAETDRAWVLAHERAHIRRGDPFWKLLGFLLLSVYWYQPVCWLGWFAFRRDLELACDETVTARLPLPERKAYALTLLNCCASKNAPFPALSFGSSPIKARVRSSLRPRRQPVCISILIIALCTGFFVCLALEPIHASQTVDALPTAKPFESTTFASTPQISKDIRPIEKTFSLGDQREAEESQPMQTKLWIIPDGHLAPNENNANTTFILYENIQGMTAD